MIKLGNADEMLVREFKQLESECSLKLEAELKAKEIKLRRDLDAKIVARNRLRELSKASRVTSDVTSTSDVEEEKERAEMETKILNMRKNHEVIK